MQRVADAGGNLANKWRRSRELADRDESSAAIDDVISLESEILEDPIESVRDAIAKLEVIGLSLVGGGRSDEADAQALRQVIDWLSRSPTGRPGPEEQA
jgi:hypothetical protein